MKKWGIGEEKMSLKPVNKLAYYTLAAIVAALMFVWPLPNTIALRLLLLFASLVIAVWLTVRQERQAVAVAFDAMKTPLFFWAALSGWILVGALTYAVAPERVLTEFWGQWIRSGLAGLMGMLVATLALGKRSPVPPRIMLGLIMLPMLAQVIIHDADSLWLWWESGVLPISQIRLMAGKDVLSYVANMAMAILCAELMTRTLFRRRSLPFSSKILGLFFIPLLFCTYVLGARNGMIGIVFLFLSCLVLYGYHRRAEMNMLILGTSLLIGVAGITGFTWLTVKADSRWQSFVETVPIAWDTKTHKAWLETPNDPHEPFNRYINTKHPFPKLHNGKEIDVSAYERISWIKEGMILLFEHPLGFGYSRTAFSDGLMLKYPGEAPPGKHSHSGLVDMALGVGVPGLFLWFGFLGSVLTLGWKGFFHNHRSAGLALIFIVTGFFGRSLVDSNLQDHVMEQFMFLVGLLATFSAMPEQKNT
ncbi:MAG: O-antigen ligase family protein [Sulfuricella sp.]|nr:O-antigen ligase family protein [Sulfuricella sp.]